MADGDAKVPATGSLVREGSTAMLSLAIAGLSLWFLYDTYVAAKASMIGADGKPILAVKEAYDRQKDLLLISLGLLGTVTGYYLGRVPAERQADAARSAAKKAEASEAQVKEKTKAAADELRRANDPAIGGGPSVVNEKIDALYKALS